MDNAADELVAESVALLHLHDRRRRRAQRRMRPVRHITGGGVAVSLWEGSVAGARSRGTLSRRPEEWQRGEAIIERKKLLHEANEESEKQCVATNRPAREQCAAQWMYGRMAVDVL